jgi:outer membrane protein assembly factor BamD
MTENFPHRSNEATAAMFFTPKKGRDRVRFTGHSGFCALLLALAFLAGCSSLPSLPSIPWATPPAQPNATAETLYRDGVTFFNDKKYVPAIERFQKLRSEYPFAPEIIPAELKLGEAFYFNKQYTEAVETLKEFQAMHPNNENVPYALYISGMAHFDQFSAVDRDQKVTEIAKGYFERVVNNYPQSPYAAKSQEKLAKCLEYLAEHEFDIASFYVREKKYPAARDRLENILRQYKDTPTAPKALFQLGDTYRLEKNNLKASLAYEALVQHYPNHSLAKTAQVQLSQLAQEKRDPLAVLLKPEGRAAAPAVAQNKEQAEEKKDLNLVAKTEVVDEKPGDEKGLLGRVVDKINPFSSSSSSSSPAPSNSPAASTKNSAEKKDQSASRAAADDKNEQSGGFFSSLWPFGGKKQEATKTSLAKNPQLVGGIDDSLKQRGIDAKQELKPPPADLPNETEKAAAPAPSATATLGAIDSKLEKKGKNMSGLPAPPEAAPALKVPYDEKEVARSKAAAATPAPDTGALLSNIDQKLKREGIDPAKADEKINTESKKIQGSSPTVAPRPKPSETIQLEPRLSAEKSPLFLQPQEYQSQEKPKESGKSDAVEEATLPNSKTTPPQSQSLPDLAVKGPPPPIKESPAETKTAAKTKSSNPEEGDENKGVLEQLKEDVGRVGKILNPFNW